MGNYHSYAIALNCMGTSLLGQDRSCEAIPYYKEASEIFSSMGDLYNEIHSHRGLYESYWETDSGMESNAIITGNMPNFATSENRWSIATYTE